MNRPVGLLTLQGDYEKHRKALAALGVETRGVRRPEELEKISALIIPGGESTTLTRLVDRVGLRQPLRDFAAHNPVMGTCAGLIMMSSELVDEQFGDFGVAPLGLLDCAVRRNGYGRQIDSFSAQVGLEALDNQPRPFEAVRCRAPGPSAGHDLPSRADRRRAHPCRFPGHDPLKSPVSAGRGFLYFGDGHGGCGLAAE